jgi:pyruvate dehydrogenase E2 component (dihydrolipoyllysine-residue acetyltransferase)
LAQTVYLPKVGMTMEEGTLCRWLVPDGAAVSNGQPIFEMETEKVQMEVEADGDGALKQLVEEGTKLKPGDVVGCLLAAGEGVPAELLATVAAQATSVERTAVAASDVATKGTAATLERQRVSPVARRLAQEAGLDLARVRGSGPGGRIVERDVRRHIEEGATAATSSVSPLPDAPAPSSGVIPYAGRRRIIGDRMLHSLQSMAQLTLFKEAPAGDATRMQHGLNREWRRDGVAVTLTALIVRACALALREHLYLNSVMEGDSIRILDDVNIGVAVDLPEGLMVPIVAHADKSSLKEVAGQVAALGQRAKGNGLKVDDVTGGTFTVTSLESYGIDAFTPIINPPQTAILGIGRVREVAAFDGPEVVRRQVVTLSLSFDHRVTDGAQAAQFLGRVAELLDRPYLLI